jgi:hypothetical protein
MHHFKSTTKQFCLLFLFLFFLGGQEFLAQPTNFNTSRNWALNKKEFYFGFGATQFLGDLGGHNGIGKDYSLRDLDFSETRIGGQIGYRYRFHRYWATTTNLNIGMMKGDDKLTTEPARHNRNLNFRSIIVELSQRIDFIFYSNEQVGRRYAIPGLKGFHNHNEQIYLFAGVGVFYYNPQGMYNGSWVNLRPLNTEGQGMSGGPKKYLPVNVSIPLGIGFKVGLSRSWRIGMEVSYHKTFTDYIDDVSGSYYSAGKIGAQNGAIAAYMSNPSPTSNYPAGSQRGDHTDKDAYFFINLNFTKSFSYGNSVGKKSTHWRSVRAKF